MHTTEKVLDDLEPKVMLDHNCFSFENGCFDIESYVSGFVFSEFIFKSQIKLFRKLHGW